MKGYGVNTQTFNVQCSAFNVRRSAFSGRSSFTGVPPYPRRKRRLALPLPRIEHAGSTCLALYPDILLVVVVVVVVVLFREGTSKTPLIPLRSSPTARSPSDNDDDEDGPGQDAKQIQPGRLAYIPPRERRTVDAPPAILALAPQPVRSANESVAPPSRPLPRCGSPPPVS
jgi:hypothetical protein